MQKRIIGLLLFLIHCTICFANETLSDIATNDQSNDNRWWITVKASSVEERTDLAALGMTLDEIDEATVSGIATKDIVDELISNNFEICSRENLESQSKALLHLGLNDYRFLSYPAMVSQVHKLAAKHPDIISIFSAGLSIQGRELIVLRINSTEHDVAASTKPGIILIGNHHAREHITAEFCIQCAKYIAKHKNEASIKSLIQNRDIFIMPMANPDGIEFDFSAFPYKFHRKNMRRFANNALGVDLNRNYDLDWGGIGASKRERQETYCGTHPFSEPETKAIKQLIEAHSNIRIMISYHSFGKLILYPWGYKRKPIENSNDLQQYITLTKELLARLPDYRAIQASNMYIVSGEATDWAYATHHIFAFTIEMMPRSPHSASGFYPTDKNAIEEDIAHNVNAALVAIEFAGI